MRSGVALRREQWGVNSHHFAPLPISTSCTSYGPRCQVKRGLGGLLSTSLLLPIPRWRQLIDPLSPRLMAPGKDLSRPFFDVC